MTNSLIKALLIDDDPDDVQLIHNMLVTAQRGRFALQTESTLAGGLSALKNTTFDILLLDLSLPDSFGLETLQSVHAEVPTVPIVVLAGFDDKERGLQALQLGAQDYLVKSDINGEMLTRAVRYALERHRIEDSLRKSEEEYRSLIVDVFNNSTVGIMILDKDFNVAWVNEAIETYFGIPREEILGKDKRLLIEDKIKCIFAEPDLFAEKILDAYQRHDFNERMECHVLPTETSTECWLEHWSQPIRSGMYAGGRIEHYTDITRRKQIESEERSQRVLAEALRDIATSLVSNVNLDEVLDRILANIEKVVPHDTSNILLTNDGTVHVARYQGYKEQNLQKTLQELRYRVDDEPVLKRILKTAQPVITPDIQKIPNWRMWTGQIWLRAHLGVPIILQEEIIGFINIFSGVPNFFTHTHADRLQAFGEQAAIAIQNAQLYEQSLRLAAVEERQRLAHELHDSVSQTLFTSSVLAESAIRQWDNNPQKAQSLIIQLHQLTNSALAEMRILLLELRPASLTQVSFQQLTQQLTQSIQSRRQLQFSINVNDISSLPSDVHIALYRILQEALNNIIKHSQATQVNIELKQNRDLLELIIEDNGKGFDTTQVSSASFGLDIMRERAESVEGKLNIKSTMGKGARITVILPYGQKKEA